MPGFNRDYHLEQLDTFQEAMTNIRTGRSDGKKINLGMRADWRNSILTVCFGVAAAFIAVGPSLSFHQWFTKAGFWAGTFLFLVNGLYIIFYVKKRIDDDSNELSTLMMEEEYKLGLLRNLFRKALKDQQTVNGDEFRNLIDDFKKTANEQSDIVAEQSKKILIIDDVWTFIFVMAFYSIGLAFIPIASRHALRYLIVGLLLIGVLLFTFYKSYQKAKTSNKEHLDWSKKIHDLND